MKPPEAPFKMLKKAWFVSNEGRLSVVGSFVNHASIEKKERERKIFGKNEETLLFKDIQQREGEKKIDRKRRNKKEKPPISTYILTYIYLYYLYIHIDILTKLKSF